jgi:hypothetical protein
VKKIDCLSAYGKYVAGLDKKAFFVSTDIAIDVCPLFWLGNKHSFFFFSLELQLCISRPFIEVWCSKQIWL